MLSIADSPLARSTEVIRLIGTYGPIKLRDLEAHVSFSRSTLHRICAQLEALNWARRRVSDKAYVLTYAIDDFFASAQFSAPEVDQIQPVLALAKAEGRYDVTLSMFKSKTHLADVDSTKPPTDWTAEHALFSSNAAISALSVMSEQAQRTLIAKASSQANREEQTDLRMGKYHQEIRTARMRGYVLDTTLPSVSFSWHAGTGAICTLTVEPAIATRCAHQAFLASHLQIKEKFSISCVSHFQSEAEATGGRCAFGGHKRPDPPSVSCHVAQDGLPKDQFQRRPACTRPVKPMTTSARPLANSAHNFPEATGVPWIGTWPIRPPLCRPLRKLDGWAL